MITQRYVLSFKSRVIKDNSAGLRAKKPLHCLQAVTDDDGHHLENEDKSGKKALWRSIFQASDEGPRRHQHSLRVRGIINLKFYYVQRAPDDIRWVIDLTEFDELTSSKNLLMTLTEFRTAPLGVRAAWSLSSY